MKIPRIAILIAAIFMLAAQASAELAVGRPLWGFDGKVRENSFALLSVEITNPGPNAFDGVLTLDARGNGAPYRQRIFLAPGTARWMQFQPYIGSFVPNWELSWKDERDRQETFDPPPSGSPAYVFVADPASPGTRGISMPVFPESLFPVSAASTDGLGAAVLNHQPRWDPARRQAFLDWVRSGGQVHLIAGTDGAMPVFTDELAMLNIPEGATVRRIGSGVVARHTVARNELTEAWLKRNGFTAPEWRTDGKGNIREIDSVVLSHLASITRPHVNWRLIYLLTVIYIVLIGPVFYVIRKRNYRMLLAGFLLIVAGFTYAFITIGRRGYGERQTYHSIGVARSLDGGRFDVREWVHAFAVSGDRYLLDFAEGSQLFGLPNFGDVVRAEILVGKESGISADIPLFSSRPFVHRGVLRTEDPGVKVESWKEVPKPGANGIDLTIAATPAFMKGAISAMVEIGGRYHDVKLTPTGFQIGKSGAGKVAGEQFNQAPHFYDYGFNYRRGSEDETAAIRELRALAPMLISYANGDDAYLRKFLSQPKRDADHARLFVFAKAPDSFGLKDPRFQRGENLVLYSFDLFKP